jgi:Lipocalin-like domain
MAGYCRQWAPQNVFGSHPKGALILTKEGRLMVLTTAEDRIAGMSDRQRAALHKSMVAYSGKYRIEGSDLITTVDLSWNEEWNGTLSGSFRIAVG